MKSVRYSLFLFNEREKKVELDLVFEFWPSHVLNEGISHRNIVHTDHNRNILNIYIEYQ